MDRLGLLADSAVRSAFGRELGRIIEYHASIGSTQDRARGLGQGGEATLVVANEQTGGHGRGDKSWLSEAGLQWRISDTGGRVIAEGIVTASQGAPGRGTYTVTVPYTMTTETVAFVEVYSRSPKDGNIDDLVRVPVTLR